MAVYLEIVVRCVMFIILFLLIPLLYQHELFGIC